MKPEPHFDLLVIGGGSGGVRAARMAAQRGHKVLLAEARGQPGLGGTCVTLGCIPKKLYSYAAHYAHAAAESSGYGWEGETPKLNWETLKANRAREVSRLNGVYAQLLAHSGVTVAHARARFCEDETVELIPTDGGAAHRVRAAHTLIATGGTPTKPSTAGAEWGLVSDEVFDLPECPRQLVVVGAGYIACEFASIFRGLGSQVTQVVRGNGLLRGFDQDVCRFLAQEMAKTGVDLRMGLDVQRIELNGSTRVVHLSDGSFCAADAVLFATGRKPNVSDLGLQQWGIEQGMDGRILVDPEYRTSHPNVHAVGDVTARVQLTPVALAEAMVVVDALFGPVAGQRPRKLSYDLIPTAVFTHPNVATVGLTEAQARSSLNRIRVFRTEFRPLKHTLSGSTERTLMKLVVDADTDRVVGLHMVGAEAGEIVQGFAVAMRAGATKADFDQTLGIHPTAAEEFVTMREPVPETP
jgi:glutathione reductase (NADPH)